MNHPLRPPLRLLTGTEHTVITHWLTGYISQPRDDLGRRGPVCPHVPAALRHGLVAATGRPWDLESDPFAETVNLITDALDLFHSWPWPPDHPELRAVIAAAPGMPRDLWPLLDQIQQQMKDGAVTGGLMIGAFHGDSAVPAAHNPHAAPNSAPYPLIVVRPMAVHDLWFLHQEEGWFREYQERFGTSAETAGATDLGGLYRSTASRFGRLPAAPAERGSSAGAVRDHGVQAAWTGLGHDLTMITVLDPCPRWRPPSSGDVLPAAGGTALLAARWAGPDDDPKAPGALAHAAALAARTPAIVPPRLAEELPENVELVALAASAVLGPWPAGPAATGTGAAR
ncbi:hypothetical protein SAMN05216251_1365 [Actinacidiphila alni]|uniref:DUF6875 domain-containing protein n=1 Tax=Actinacidiphila alni TaxID=380248 RepID=A0A1I2MGX6_9ACTN|nr:hypothetical protein [Actinacidiphila alni]SFF90723.1 hypothetical protein SAMN05216251_1365 [Actinacidiphila alni]